MNAILKENIRELARRQPLLAKRIAAFVPEDAQGIKTEHATSGMVVSALPDIRFLEPNAAPRETARIVDPVVCLKGVGIGVYLAAVLAALPRNVRFVVAIEPYPPIAAVLLQRIPIYRLVAGRDVVFVIFDDVELVDEAVKAAFGTKGFYVGEAFVSLAHSGESESAPARIEALVTAFRKSLAHNIALLGNSAEDSLLGLRQMALTSPWTMYAHSFEALRAGFAGRPAVVVAAGPSLDRNLHHLRGRTDRFLVIAVDTALRKLLKEGIVPHIVCALERGIEVYEYHFRSLLDEKRPELSSVVLVMQSVCVPRIAGRWPGPVVIVGKKDIVLDREVVGGILGGRVVPSGSSVAHMGLGIAWAIGAGEVALIGQDLAFEPGGRSHASGTAWERGGNETKIPKKDRLLVPAIDGGTVETTRTWKYFIDTFERMILELRMPVFDCTEGGAFIPGTVVRPFVEYLESERSGYEDESAIACDCASGKDSAPPGFDKGYIRLQKAMADSLALTETGLKRLESLRAPLLSDARRTLLITNVRAIVNELVTGNPVLAYIGQAQFARLIAANYRLSNLEDRPTLRQWIDRHVQFLENQRTSARIAQGWLYYIDGVRQMETEIRNRLAEKAEEKSIADGILEKGNNESMRTAIRTDIYLSRTDPSGFTGDAGRLWAFARHFMEEKRFAEADGLLSTVEQTDAFDAFAPCVKAEILKDRRRCLLSRDLCWRPDTEKAGAVLARAYAFAPENASREAFMDEFLKGRKGDEGAHASNH